MTKSKIAKSIGIMFAGVVVGLLIASASQNAMFGGVYNNVIKDFAQGISVDGTVVIDGDGNVDAPITSTTGSFSGDLTIDTTDLFVDVSANKVGVGTSSPSQIFHVTSGSATTTPKFGSETAGATCIELTTNANALVGAYIVGTSWVIEAGGCN